MRKPLYLVLEDGSVFGGFSFGADIEGVTGEVVFNTGMVGYPESFTDPSYKGQILVLTYPLIGNYGVPDNFEQELSHNYESAKIHISGLIVSEYSDYHHHWTARRGLSNLLKEQGIPGIEGVDTRALTKRLRINGTMAGKITSTPHDTRLDMPFRCAVLDVSTLEIKEYGSGKKRVAVVDCGCKNTIIRSLLNRGLKVLRVPWDFDATSLDINGILFSNGPGDPHDCTATIKTAKKAIEMGIPAFGICLGNQILGLAAGASTFKLKYGHRGQNVPCVMKGSRRCFITSQNHGYAVDSQTLPDGWETWFENLNDNTNEGIRHVSLPFMGVQFHPEAMPGPVDTGFLFDEFIGMLR